MVRRSEAEWRSLFEAHANSGLNASQFCKEHNLNPKYFSLRRKQILERASKQKPSTFIKVQPPSEVSTGTSDVRLKIGRVELQFAALAPEYVASVVKHLI